MHRLALPVVFFATALLASGQTSFPMITHSTPTAIQRGTTVEITVDCQMSFADPLTVLFDHPGLTATIVPPDEPKAEAKAEPKPEPKAKADPKTKADPKAKTELKPDPKAKADPKTKAPAKMDAKAPARIASAKIKVTAAPDCPMGPHEFRIATRLGLSSVGQLVVTAEPVTSESADNNTIAKATPLSVPGVGCGRIEAVEDVDYFKIHAEAGEVLSLEVFGARIQDKIHDLQKHLDPILTICDAKGRELSVNDDYFFADPYMTFKVPATGDYFIQIRDSKYDGDARWSYALIVTNKPYVAHAFPFAGNPGQTLTVEPIGFAGLTARVQLPTQPGMHELPLMTDKGPTNPIAFVVSGLPQVMETEPNDSIAQAQEIPIPCMISGQIGKPRDLDCFAIHGEKGKAIRLEVRARRFGTSLQSSLDAIVEILNPKGAIIASNDDDPTTGKDPLLVFSPPADGEYYIRIRDLNSKGGPGFVYTLEVDIAKPDFTMRCDSARAMIGPGNRTAWYVHVNRLNGFAGPVKIDVNGLPPGVTVNPLTIPASMTQGLLVLTAEKDAKPGSVSRVRVQGSADEIVRTALANEEIYLPGGGRGRFDVGLHAISVTRPSDIESITVEPKQLTLKPGQEVKLDITVKRQADYTGDVILDVPLRHLEQAFSNPLPTGVTVVGNKSKTLLKPTESKGHIVLKVADDAPEVSDVPINVAGYVSINFVVKIGFSSPVIPLSIKK